MKTTETMAKKPYNTNFTVQAESADEANKIFHAMAKLVKNIPADDMKFIGDLTEQKGNWVPKAKPYVNLL